MKINITSQDLQDAEILWTFLTERQVLQKSKVIVGLGSFDTRVAVYSAQLFLKGWADWLVFTGGIAHQNDLAKTPWNIPEATMFAKIAMDAGVPEDKILLEKEAQHTGQNFELTQRLCDERGIDIDSAIIVSKPYMGKRALATGMKYWPEKNMVFTSEPIRFQEYLDQCEVAKETVFHVMVGNVQRLSHYAMRGFQAPVAIPAHVHKAMQQLIKRGFNQHLVKTS